jgi:hypothetical protein
MTLTTVRITRQQVDHILGLCLHHGSYAPGKCECHYTNQTDALIALYKLVHPNWDQIVYFNDYPICSAATSNYIMRRFIAFDRAHHPACMAGGCWMSKGWTSIGGEHLDEFEVIPASVSFGPKDAFLPMRGLI